MVINLVVFLILKLVFLDMSSSKMIVFMLSLLLKILF